MLLLERDAQHSVYEHVVSEAAYLQDRPQVCSQVEQLQQRWDHMYADSEDRSQVLQRALVAWASLDDHLTKVQELEDSLEDKLKTQPGKHSTELAILDKELGAYKVCENTFC